MNAPVVSALPADVLCAADYEAAAGRSLDAAVFAYVNGGAGGNGAVHANRRAFERHAIYPRLLRDVGEGHTRLHLAGVARAHPFFLAPVAYQGLFHDDAEIATASAAAVTDTCMVASTLSSVTLEGIAGAGVTDPWFQLYLQPDRDANIALIRRAEAAGYQALVVTLDAPVQPMGLAALRAGFRLPPGEAANLATFVESAPLEIGEGDSRIFQGAMRRAPRWADLEWVLAYSQLPVWIKGVMHPDDARALRALGAAGLVVSNHGGRVLECAPATLDVLPAIRQAVGADYPLLLDGGIRSGSDAFKAIALGANAVLVGRLQAHALAVAGALGVAHLVRLLREELELTMALAGCATLADIRPETLHLHPC